MLGKYINVRPLYQFGELIDSYEFSLAALHSDRSIYDSIAHKSEATQAWDGPVISNIVLNVGEIKHPWHTCREPSTLFSECTIAS